jgi:radical SAM protein with 4Fe4S-binding SPASM domain
MRLSYYLSVILRKPHLWGEPVAVAIEPVNFCNLRCPECPVGNGDLTRDSYLLETSCFQKIINQLSRKIFYINLCFQGEPFLHPDFTQLVKITSDKGYVTATSTNGHFLQDRNKVKNLIEAGLDRLVVSVDGTTQEVYEKYRRNGNLQQVIDGIKNVVELKKELNSSTPFVEMQFLVMSYNEHQVPEVRKLAKQLDVNKLTFKTMQVYDFENGSDFFPKQERFNRYRLGKDGKYHLKGRMKKCCWRQWSSVVISSTGDVLPCCFDKNGKYAFGNVFDHSFKEIWHGKKAFEFRQAILKHRNDIDICKNCIEV